MLRTDTLDSRALGALVALALFTAPTLAQTPAVPIGPGGGGGGGGSLTGTSGAIPYFNSSGAAVSSPLLTQYQLLLGGGAGAAPAAIGSLGSTTTVLHGNASGAPTWGQVNLATDVTGALPTAINAQTGTSYTVLASDQGKLVTFSNASAVAASLPQATGSFAAGFCWSPQNKGPGTVTITPTNSTINGVSTLALTINQGVTICSDGANWQLGNAGLGGSGAAPGGSNGQLQYDNSSAFGGFTLGGDCTFSVPNITCTKLNGVAVTLGGPLTTTGASTPTLAFAASGSPTYTFPGVSATFPGVGIANTWTAPQTISVGIQFLFGPLYIEDSSGYLTMNVGSGVAITSQVAPIYWNSAITWGPCSSADTALCVGNAPGSSAYSVEASSLFLNGVIYSSAGTALPTCNAGNEGRHATVSDATSRVSGTLYGSGGGSIIWHVFCDAANWYID
jgi:hypothetical protein